MHVPVEGAGARRGPAARVRLRGDSGPVIAVWGWRLRQAPSACGSGPEARDAVGKAFGHARGGWGERGDERPPPDSRLAEAPGRVSPTEGEREGRRGEERPRGRAWRRCPAVGRPVAALALPLRRVEEVAWPVSGQPLAVPGVGQAVTRPVLYHGPVGSGAAWAGVAPGLGTGDLREEESSGGSVSAGVNG